MIRLLAALFAVIISAIAVPVICAVIVVVGYLLFIIGCMLLSLLLNIVTPMIPEVESPGQQQSGEQVNNNQHQPSSEYLLKERTSNVDK